MREAGNKYQWSWALIVLPTMLMSLVVLFLTATPLVIPIVIFVVCYSVTSRWKSVLARFFVGIAVSIGSIWILPLPSILIAQYHFSKFDIGNIRAITKVRPSGNILRVRSTRYARAPEECDYQCFRYLALASVISVTITNMRPTRFDELISGVSSGKQFSKTLKLASGSDCEGHSVEVNRSVQNDPAFVSILRKYCVVETSAPKQFDLTFRSGEVFFDGVQSGSGSGNGNDIDTSYMHGTYYETRLRDGSVLSRLYDMQVCPIAAPLFLSRRGRGLTLERDCKRSEINDFAPINGLDLSEPNQS